MLAFLVCGLPSALNAQVRGTVLDEAGHPLADAVVDLWTTSERVVRRITREDGQFTFAPTDSGVRITVRRIGSSPAVRSVPGTGDPIDVVLIPGPVSVAALQVEGHSCTARDDGSARAAWAGAAAHYKPLADSLWLGSELKIVQERVAFEAVGHPALDSTGFGWTAGSRFADRTSAWQRRISLAGYHLPDPEVSDLEQTFEGSLHQRWVSPEFGREVKLTWLEDRTLRFCPRSAKHPYVEGEIRLGEDGTILLVRWRFGPPSGEPATGGEALFVAPAPDSSIPLLPSSETLWQERLRGEAAQRSIEYREWRVTREEPHWH